MNDTMSTETGHRYHPPEPTRQQSPVVRRVGFIDRIALYLGVALVSWSRRPRAVAAEPLIRTITSTDAAHSQAREFMREAHAHAQERERAQQVYPRFIIR